MKNDDLELDSKAVAALPIINAFIERLELRELLAHYLPSKKNLKYPHADAMLLFVRNILLERQPLYRKYAEVTIAGAGMTVEAVAAAIEQQVCGQP